MPEAMTELHAARGAAGVILVVLADPRAGRPPRPRPVGRLPQRVAGERRGQSGATVQWCHRRDWSRSQLTPSCTLGELHCPASSWSSRASCLEWGALRSG